MNINPDWYFFDDKWHHIVFCDGHLYIDGKMEDVVMGDRS